jgi:tRNA wybutosine-synthesizing protein 3
LGSAFDAQKAVGVSEFKAALHAGDVDAELVSILSRINSHRDYYTTSSCAGRISLISDAGSKRESVFLGKWHGPIEASEVLRALKPVKGVTYFRFEPAIIHVAARNVEAADILLKAAISCGFKRSGIQSVKDGRVLLEVLGTERIDAPVADGGRVVVESEYLRFLIALANVKYGTNLSKLRRLEKKFLLL